MFLPSHVTGIIASNGALSRGLFRGIAPNANIISLKILDKYGKGNSLAAISAIQWVMENKNRYNIKIINMSAGTSERTVNVPLVRAVENAIDLGITVVAADSNSGFSSSITSPGISPGVITVGSSEDYPSIRSYKSGTYLHPVYYKKPDLYAPGSEIASCLSPDYRFEERIGAEKNITHRNYIKMSGSSMATPIISGIAALMYEKNPKLTPEEIKTILTSSLLDESQIPMPDIRKIFNL